jgi:hypothetical protein
MWFRQGDERLWRPARRNVLSRREHQAHDVVVQADDRGAGVAHVTELLGVIDVLNRDLPVNT